MESYQLTLVVFVSKPTKLNAYQSTFEDRLKSALKLNGLRSRGLGSTDYSNKAPLLTVLETISGCDGAIILGFTTRLVKDIGEKEATETQYDQEQISLPTPWNNLEAGIAFTLNLPLLIISENRIMGGVFDADVADKLIHHINLSFESKSNNGMVSLEGYFRSEEFLQPFKKWHEEVILYNLRRRRKRKEDITHQ
jgi:hypothetical protein